MNVRRIVVAAAVALGLLATTPAGAAGTIALDGKRTKAKTWSGELSEVALPMSASTRPSFQPLVEDCTSASTCDVKELRLTLPKNTSKGIFSVQVVVELPLMAAVGLYKPNGETILVDDGLLLGPAYGDEENLYEYTLDLSRYRMDPGRYLLAIINRGGQGPYKATLHWTAHPPDRRTKR